jgi:nitrile hydratase accessory protein
MNTDLLLDIPESAAPPRRNGELVFEQPWESLVFGITLGLCEHGDIRFEDFQRRLVEEIAVWENGPRSTEWSYWTCWLAALEGELDARGVLARGDVDRRTFDVVRSFAHEKSGTGHGHGH